MRAPKILPWVAKKAGISEELALKLWRRAAGESERLQGKSSGSEYYALAVERFLLLAEAESPSLLPGALCAAPRLTWAWQHQNQMSRLSAKAVENAYQGWQQAWRDFYSPRRAA